MQVNQANVAVVAAIFGCLTDERFSMRTPSAIVKFGNDAERVTEGAVLDTAAQMGITFRRRIRDGATLIERPGTVEQAREIVAKCDALRADESVTFDLDFTPAQSQADAELDSEGDDEDRHFGVH